MKIDFSALAVSTNKKSAQSELPEGGYVVKIIFVVDIPDKQCFRLYYDIAEGKYAHFYNGISTSGFHPGVFYVSYKESTYRYLARFIKNIQEANPGYMFTGNESELVGKLLGLVLRREEYINKYGKKGIKMAVLKYASLEDIRNGNCPVTSSIKKPVEKDFIIKYGNC